MTPTEALDSEYETGIADVLAYLAGDSAQVERGVRLPGRLSGARRRIGVLVRGQVYGHEAATLVVGAKRWRTAADVADVGRFTDLVNDVGADYGLLVANRGPSPAGAARALNEPGARVDVMAVEELLAWRPAGTVTIAYGVAAADLGPAAGALRGAGFRVAGSAHWKASDDSPVIEIFRHYGPADPSAEVRTGALDLVERVLARARVEGTLLAQNVVVAGGTGSHRWLEITVSGRPSGSRLLAATEADADEQLERWGAAQGLQRDRLGYLRPDRWPAAALFPAWGVGDASLLAGRPSQPTGEPGTERLPDAAGPGVPED